MSIHDRVAQLEYLVADLKRRESNYIRPGVVDSFDGDANTIVANIGSDDEPAMTHPVQLFTHGGTGKSWRPMKKGQQITLLCPDGDLANAIALPGGFHDVNPAPSQSADEDIEAQRGSTRLRTTDSAAYLECGGASIKVEDGTITISAGGSVATISGAGLTLKNGDVTHDGHSIGKTHVHTLVAPGGSESGPPP